MIQVGFFSLTTLIVTHKMRPAVINIKPITDVPIAIKVMLVTKLLVFANISRAQIQKISDIQKDTKPGKLYDRSGFLIDKNLNVLNNTLKP